MSRYEFTVVLLNDKDSNQDKNDLMGEKELPMDVNKILDDDNSYLDIKRM